MLLPSIMFNSFVSAVQTYYPNAVGISGEKNFFNGYGLNVNPKSSWPPLSITFDGVTIRIPPSVYFIKISHTGVSYYYLGISKGIDSVSIC